MPLEIVKYPSPILKLTAEKIQDIDGSILELAHKMILTMKVNGGVGLAMPQIGLAGRLIVFIDYASQPRYRVMINPSIVGREATHSYEEEGCLSVPGLYVTIPRAKAIDVQFQEPSGEWKRELFWDFTARIIQHEIDHLNGVLIND